MKTVIKGGRVITAYRILQDHGLVIEDGKIQEIFSGDYNGTADEVIDVKGRYISPGFVDLHIHGGGGHDYMDGTVEAVIEASKTHMHHGTTSLTPTLTSGPWNEMLTAVDAYMEAKKVIQDGPNLLGMHMEGPYVSMTRSGGQLPQYVRPINLEEIRALLDHCPDIVRMNAAPEEPHGIELGRILRDRGILASIGHADNMYDNVLEACENGYSLITHFYSGCTMLERRTHRRELGMVETGYMLDEMNVELICDGIHLPPEVLKLVFKQKPWHLITLTTDSSRGADLPEGTEIRTGNKNSGKRCIVKGGVSMRWDGLAYGGSVCTTDRCVRTAVQQANVPLVDAVRMMSLNPARLIGAASKGSIAIGKDADLCFFGDDIHVVATMVGGRMLHNQMD